MTHLSLYRNQLTGTVPPALRGLTKLMWLRLYDNQLTGIAPGTLGPLVAIRVIDLDDNLFAQAATDDALMQIFTARMAYNRASPVVEIGGAITPNAAPSGTLTDPALTPGAPASNADWSWDGTCHQPLSGQAYRYVLANDPCGEGFNPWTVSTTP